MTKFQKSHFFQNVFVGPVSLSEIWSIFQNVFVGPVSLSELFYKIFYKIQNLEKSSFQKNENLEKKVFPPKCRGTPPTSFLYYSPLKFLHLFLNLFSLNFLLFFFIMLL